MKQVKPCPFECNANDCKDCGAYTYSHHTQTNEEWFNKLSTETKARIAHLVYMAGYRDGCNKVETLSLQDIMEWLKQNHTNREEKHNEVF